ncbi:MAG: type II toxin-antitoxin system VapC family toxin [Hyphomicrobiaceae bacterium]|nr:type II toxin-antitoxin system VapC family toxin [Hyphomicrobiaceae bacterium]
MISLDTNVIVRLLVADDADQARRARDLLANSPVLVTTTVILECEWVLRGAYAFKEHEIADAFKRLFGLPQLTLAEPNIVLPALNQLGQGMDFADALHLSGSTDAEQFASFDRSLRKRAARMVGLPTVIEP